MDPLTSPCLVGVCRPVIVLPLTLPQGSLSEALLHELSHYKTRDSWWVLLRCACCAVHWFNPLVWVAQRLVRTGCELACDERIALRLTPEERMHYADTLIRTARKAYTPRAGVITTGITMTGKQLMRRVNGILHLKAVQKMAAALVAAVLAVLSLAAFSTEETDTQRARMTSDTSAFPFLPNDAYPAPDNVFGEAVALMPLTDTAQAQAQALRYLCALYPGDQPYMETQYQYQVRQFGKTGWEVVAWPPEGSNWAAYYMELKSAGGLESIIRTDITYANGDERNNSPSVLPNNLADVLLVYGQRIGTAALQNVAVDKATIHADTETAAGRYVVCDLTNTQDDSVRVSLSVQIAPTFSLMDVDIATDVADTAAQANPPIEQGRSGWDTARMPPSPLTPPSEVIRTASML